MATRPEPDQVSMPPHPGTPRWVKVFGILAGALFLFVLYSIFSGGGHGPSRRASSGEGGGQAGPGRLGSLGALFLTVGVLNWGWLADKGLVPSGLVSH